MNNPQLNQEEKEAASLEMDGVFLPKDIAIMIANAYPIVANAMANSTVTSAADANHYIKLCQQFHQIVADKWAEKQPAATDN